MPIKGRYPAVIYDGTLIALNYFRQVISEVSIKIRTDLVQKYADIDKAHCTNLERIGASNVSFYWWSANVAVQKLVKITFFHKKFCEFSVDKYSYPV